MAQALPSKPPRLVSPTEMGRTNRARVLQALCDYGPLSRASLAKLANVSRATIGGVVQPLVESRLLEEGEPDATNNRGGMPGRPLWFAQNSGLSATASIEGAVCRAALVNARGEILDEKETPFDFDPNRSLADGQARAVAHVLRSVMPRKESLLGVGVAVPGACDAEQGIVVGSVQVPAWTNYPLTERLEDLLGVAVFIDNDARCQALGEKWFGAGRGISKFASIQTGQGLGVGLVLDGVIFRGEGGLTGELGHTCVNLEGEECRCGLRGCWETIATLRWLRNRAEVEGLPQPEIMTSDTLVELVTRGDPAAARLLEQYADNLSAGLANLANLLNPQRMILHGDVAHGGEILLSAIRERTRARALPHIAERLEIVLSPLGERAGLLGAGGLVLSETFQLIA